MRALTGAGQGCAEIVCSLAEIDTRLCRPGARLPAHRPGGDRLFWAALLRQKSPDGECAASVTVCLVSFTVSWAFPGKGQAAWFFVTELDKPEAWFPVIILMHFSSPVQRAGVGLGVECWFPGSLGWVLIWQVCPAAQPSPALARDGQGASEAWYALQCVLDVYRV